MSDVGGYWPSGEEQRANAGSLYCSGGQKRKMNNYSTWWVGWTVTGRAWLTRTPVCSTRHHRCAGTGHVRAMRDEKERQASCVLPQEAKQARGTVALDREDSTRSRRCWPGPQAWASEPPAPPTALRAVSSGTRSEVRNTEAPRSHMVIRTPSMEAGRIC